MPKNSMSYSTVPVNVRERRSIVRVCKVLLCPVLLCPVLLCPVLLCPVLLCPVLLCPTSYVTFYSCFRQFRHAVMADITAMYNQIQILPEDQDALSFIWVDDDIIAKYCMTSQLWCSSSSACAFNKTEELTAVVTVRSMMEYSLYVDDHMWSIPSVKIANSTLTELLSTSLKRGFKLVKFIATNENILESISGDASMHLFIIDVCRNSCTILVVHVTFCCYDIFIIICMY